MDIILDIMLQPISIWILCGLTATVIAMINVDSDKIGDSFGFILSIFLVIGPFGLWFVLMARTIELIKYIIKMNNDRKAAIKKMEEK